MQSVYDRLYFIVVEICKPYTEAYQHKHIYLTPSANATSSNVCNQLNIIMLRSYFESGLPRSLSTSWIVSGRFLLEVCCFVLFVSSDFEVEMHGCFGIGLVPGTVSLDTSLSADIDTSSRSRLNSLWDSLSMAL